MGYTNKTSHYDLPQWIAGDKPSWLGDVNTAMLNIDTAIAGADASATAAESSAAAANAQVQAQEAKITKNTTDIQALTEQLADVSGVANAALPKNGGTMTGALTLAGAPTQDLQAATKKYVDENGAGAVTTFEKFAENLTFMGADLKWNKAVFGGYFNGDTLATTFTGTVVIGAGTFVPLLKCAGNAFNLTTKNPPTADSDLHKIAGSYTVKDSNSTALSQKCVAYFDGTNTYIGIAIVTSQVNKLHSATIDGFAFEVV